MIMVAIEVASASPMIMAEVGSVAAAGSGAKLTAASAPTAMMIDEVEPPSACVTESRPILRMDWRRLSVMGHHSKVKGPARDLTQAICRRVHAITPDRHRQNGRWHPAPH